MYKTRANFFGRDTDNPSINWLFIFFDFVPELVVPCTVDNEYVIIFFVFLCNRRNRVDFQAYSGCFLCYDEEMSQTKIA